MPPSVLLWSCEIAPGVFRLGTTYIGWSMCSAAGTAGAWVLPDPGAARSGRRHRPSRLAGCPILGAESERPAPAAGDLDGMSPADRQQMAVPLGLVTRATDEKPQRSPSQATSGPGWRSDLAAMDTRRARLVRDGLGLGSAPVFPCQRRLCG